MVSQVLYWAPRVLALAYALFLGTFALDAFGEGFGFRGTFRAVMMHLIPTYIVLIVLALAWRREKLGAILFAALAIFYIIWTWGNHWSSFVAIAGPLLLIGVLFQISWMKPGHRDRNTSADPKEDSHG